MTPPSGYVNPGDPMRQQGRWCPDHHRFECVHQRSKGRGTCHGSTVRGTDACRMHAGRNAQVVKQERERRMAIEDAAQRFGLAVETTAEAALCDALNLAEGRVQYYLARVQELKPAQLTEGVERITRRVKPAGAAGPGTIVEDVTVAKTTKNVLLTLLDEAERHRVQVAEIMARLGIEQHRLQVAKEHGGLLWEVVLLTLRRSGLSAEQQEMFKQQFPIAAGEVLPDD